MIWELVLREGLYIAVTFRVWLVSCVAFFGFRETAMDLTFGMFFYIIFPPTKCFTLRRILGNTFKKIVFVFRVFCPLTCTSECGRPRSAGTSRTWTCTPSTSFTTANQRPGTAFPLSTDICLKKLRAPSSQMSLLGNVDASFVLLLSLG